MGKGDVVVVPLQGEIAPSLALFLRRAEKETRRAPARPRSFSTWTPTAAGSIPRRRSPASSITPPFPTYTYINTNAGSAGALIALATKHIYMAPVSAIGAAAPILSTGEDLPPTAKDKTISYLVRAHPQQRRPQRPQSRRRRGLHEQGEGGQDRQPRRCIRKARSSPSTRRKRPRRSTANRSSPTASRSRSTSW